MERGHSVLWLPVLLLGVGQELKYDTAAEPKGSFAFNGDQDVARGIQSVIASVVWRLVDVSIILVMVIIFGLAAKADNTSVDVGVVRRGS